MSTSTRGRTLVVNDEAIVRAMPMLLRASVVPHLVSRRGSGRTPSPGDGANRPDARITPPRFIGMKQY